ncbi:hypothetical protein AB3R30_16010 [Leptolyngbyaceae cyanobacterium UHCC 1019]
MGKFKVTYLNQDSQEVEADGYYQKNNQFEFYQDSAVGEQRVLSLSGTEVAHIQNLEEKAKVTDSQKYQIAYHSGQEEEIQFDGYHENGDWFDFYRDSVVGEKTIQSVKMEIVRQIEQL